MSIKINVGIVGGAGYTAGELIRLLLNHPNVNINFVHSKSNAGKYLHTVHNDLLGDTELLFVEEIYDEADVIFLCVGYTEAKKFLKENITIVCPSGFRTDWAGRSAEDSPIKIDDYATTAGQNKANIRGYSGNQPGDPTRAAKAIVKAVDSENPPLRLLLGVAALTGARAKLEELKKDFDAWEETSVGADFPKEV